MWSALSHERTGLSFTIAAGPRQRSNSLVHSESELLYDWRVTANQFVLEPSPLRLTTGVFFLSTEPLRSQSLCIILSDERMSVPLKNMLGLVKCMYRTYSMLLIIPPFALHTSPLSVQALQSRSCLSYVSYATMAA
jgi:hypothetical protein